MKTFIFCALCVICSASSSFAQVNNPSYLKAQATRLKSYFDQHEIEKVYLHFDKPYYAAGDTIYFKAYVMAGEKNLLSTLSGVLYTDLIDPAGKVASSIKLQINNGLAWGDFALRDSLPSGNYRVRAYTRLMQNYGSESFFNRRIPIAAIINKPLPAFKSKSSSASQTIAAPDVQFFPEGGDLVTGVASKVAFKAVMPGGNGTDVTGNILNDKNQVVTTFTSAHLGMGVFTITPLAGESYHAEVVYSNGIKASIPLPAVNAEGVAIAVTDSGSKISVHVNPGKLFYQQNKDGALGLFIYSAGRLTTVSDVMDGPDMRFDIQKGRLHSGITQVTLLSAKGEPLCERLVYINKNDQLPVDVFSAKTTYQAREKVTVKIHVDETNFEPTPAHFSVSVIDKSKVTADENKEENILTYTLLTSCLKGYVEDPGYYFVNPDNKKRSELDLVMLTHGYRRFTWAKLAADDGNPPMITAEKGLSISGQAKTFWGKPVNPGEVTLIPAAGGHLLSEATDKTGSFKFDNLVFYDTTRFVLNAVTGKGSNNTQLTYHPAAPVPVLNTPLYTSTDTSAAAIISAYLQNSQNRHTEFMKYYGKGIQLKEVRVQSVKKATYRTLSLAGAGNADQVIKGSEILTGGMLATSLSGRIGGVYFENPDNPAGGSPRIQGATGLMLIIVDGVERPDSRYAPKPIVNDILPADVETIEVLKYASASIYGMQGGNGVLIITTKQGVGREAKDIAAVGVLPLKITGYYKAREFYAPRYDYINDHTRPDLRSTVYWLPEIMTDKNGNASFDFYNADGNGQYEIIVEGINSDGDAGAAKYSYEVKE